MNSALRAKLHQMGASMDTGEGRTLEELKWGTDTLKGVESQRLRTFCTSNRMVPGRDLDEFGKLLANGDLRRVQAEFNSRVERLTKDPSTSKDPSEAAANELFTMRWGPTAVPIFNLLLLFTLKHPPGRPQYLAIARWMTKVAKVPIGGTDLSGTTALSYSIGTKPFMDTDFAQILYDAGGDLNDRNRYGATAGHEIIAAWARDAESIQLATEALEWFLAHGGNADVKDGDGMDVRFLARLVPSLLAVVHKEDRRRAGRAEKCCTFCGREDAEKLLLCSRCKKERYCPPGHRTCQKLDWARHRPGCRA